MGDCVTEWVKIQGKKGKKEKHLGQRRDEDSLGSDHHGTVFLIGQILA